MLCSTIIIEVVMMEIDIVKFLSILVLSASSAMAETTEKSAYKDLTSFDQSVKVLSTCQRTLQMVFLLQAKGLDAEFKYGKSNSKLDLSSEFNDGYDPRREKSLALKFPDNPIELQYKSANEMCSAQKSVWKAWIIKKQGVPAKMLQKIVTVKNKNGIDTYSDLLASEYKFDTFMFVPCPDKSGGGAGGSLAGKNGQYGVDSAGKNFAQSVIGQQRDKSDTREDRWAFIDIEAVTDFIGKIEWGTTGGKCGWVKTGTGYGTWVRPSQSSCIFEAGRWNK